MCKWGTNVTIWLSHSDKKISVDSCMAEIILALNNGGVHTVASCCGHGNRPGNIVLADGRELVIIPDYDSARRLDKFFYDIHGKGEDNAG